MTGVRSVVCAWLCALASPAWGADYTCADPRSERIRQALGIQFDLDARQRTLEQCVAQEWPESGARARGIWILGIVERRYSSEGGEYVFRLFVARQEGDGFRLEGRYDGFRVLWPRKPHWEEGIVDFDVREPPSPDGRPAFGVRFRAAYEYKMDAHWTERRVLFASGARLVPLSVTEVRSCDCRVDDEMYPTGCFEQRSCPGTERPGEQNLEPQIVPGVEEYPAGDQRYH